MQQIKIKLFILSLQPLIIFQLSTLATIMVDNFPLDYYFKTKLLYVFADSAVESPYFAILINYPPSKRRAAGTRDYVSARFCH